MEQKKMKDFPFKGPDEPLALTEEFSVLLYRNEPSYGSHYNRSLMDTLHALHKQGMSTPSRLDFFISECINTGQPVRLDTFLQDKQDYTDESLPIMYFINRLTELVVIIRNITIPPSQIHHELKTFWDYLNTFPRELSDTLKVASQEFITEELDIRDNQA